MNTEARQYFSTYKEALKALDDSISKEDLHKLRKIIKQSLKQKIYKTDPNKGDLLLLNIETVLILVKEIGLKSSSVLATMLFRPALEGVISLKGIEKTFDADVASIVEGIIKVTDLENRESAAVSENYINLLLSLAQDMRVILIMIANKLHLMRNCKKADEAYKTNLIAEASYIYTPLAHKLGLYKVKSEFEDLYLKYTDREAYDYIVYKLKESKEARDEYIAEFIKPIEEKLQKTGLNYEIKGRTKSIFSINNKLKKQQIEFEGIYDLFAIRVTLDSPLPKEKADCWQVYSIITDLYQPNPKRLKDWLSIPKSNGYESLHITVMGPGNRWVEVQVRTERMDEIAERGLAAHWKYKGVKSESNIDDWLTNLREVLENKSLERTEKLEHFKLDLYDEEIYIFTPKGDVHKLPKGATVLDFAFSIHSKLGSKCISGKVNEKNVSIRHQLNNGDTVEIMTSPNQSPKQDWLSFVTTSKAKNKIRQSLKEETNKQVDFAKELLKRRLKNRKIEEDEAVLMKLIKKKGFKMVTDFYIEIAKEALDINHVIDQYVEMLKKEQEIQDKQETISAQEFITHTINDTTQSKDELVIDKNLTGIDYKLAKCCNPIFGDSIFGFVSSQGIKIHRTNCPNAQDMFSRFAYRVIPARWSGKSGSGYTITLRVIGHDDIGIVSNLTSIISKENGVSMRSISIDSNDGLFQGNISVTLQNTDMLNGLIKKLKTVKGVKQISRIN